jgi:hypothetical protein
MTYASICHSFLQNYPIPSIFPHPLVLGHPARFGLNADVVSIFYAIFGLFGVLQEPYLSLDRRLTVGSLSAQ